MEKYTTPKIEIIEFENEDIITRSGNDPSKPIDLPFVPIEDIIGKQYN